MPIANAKLGKCSFDCKQVEFLGYVISSKGISMDPAKVKVVLEWQTPRSLRDVQCFLGFSNFYRKFIQDYSKIILPLTQLTKKGHAFIWSNEADMAFRHLKEAFTSAPILAHVDTNKPFIMEADASYFALGSMCTKAITSEETAALVMREVFRHHGLPDSIIGDRGPQFIWLPSPN